MCWRGDANNGNGNTNTRRKACLNWNLTKKKNVPQCLLISAFFPLSPRPPTNPPPLSVQRFRFLFRWFYVARRGVWVSGRISGGGGRVREILSSGVGGLLSFFICLLQQSRILGYWVCGAASLKSSRKENGRFPFPSIPIRTKQCHKFPDSDNWWQIFLIHRIIRLQISGNARRKKG